MPGHAPEPFVLTDAMLRRLDMPGPRYTSYPTADRFVEAFGAAEYRQALRQRAEGAVVGGAPPLSIYVHIPFCESLCYYCACNKVITRHHERARPYLDDMRTEIALHVAELGPAQGVSQLHFGGGSPTFLSDAELDELMALLRRSFRVAAGAEIGIEVDPRTASPERLGHLAALGFNRISFGVQDFDPAVQQAVHRVQPFEMVRDLVVAARARGFGSINTDLIYGLPKQTPESFARTVAQVSELRPDRIALYSYAHLPQRFKPQRRILTVDLPHPEKRIRMLESAIAGFLAHGYVYIGMDHFALPDDALAVAKRQGRLHRNFQGYSTQPECDLIGLGVSSIGRVGATYSQNAKTLQEYHDALALGEFPVVRGLALTRDDLVRRAIIMALMCQGRVEFESIDLAHLVRMREAFAPEFERLRPLEEMGLVEVGDEAIQVTPLGWYFVRAVAMVFDRHLQASQVRERFSRII
ncbi:MAG: oxygen-independent coproporphyrinogen III oxidase [Burkholderiales bacterium]|nr:oxygen-independent coproporphyrinogen III oxidase [Burkholderiales bacterium]